MNAQEFAYWLNGFVEMGGNEKPPTEAQWKMICEHLALVFNKVTPPLKSVEPQPQEKIEDWLKRIGQQKQEEDKQSPFRRGFPYDSPPFIPTDWNQPGLPGVFPDKPLVVTC